MMKGTIAYVGLLLLLCLGACAPNVVPTPPYPTNSTTSTATAVNPGFFDRIVVYGPLQVIVTNDHSLTRYRLQSTHNMPLSSIATFYVQNHVLYISAVNPPQTFNSSTPVGCLSVMVPQLNAVAAHNGGKIFIDNINTPHFIVKADGQGFIELNGRATRLDVTLLDKTRLDARHLSVRTLFINTAGMAQADVQNSQGLSVFSTDKSDVYFYTDPAALADYERQSGSTLRMKGIAPEDTPPENNRYIK